MTDVAYNRRMGKSETPQVASSAERQARVDLAAAFRLAVRMDLHEGVCNHFTVMLPQGKRFLLNAYGLHWSEVTGRTLVRCIQFCWALGRSKPETPWDNRRKHGAQALGAGQ